METEGREFPGSCEERESRLPAGERGAGSGVCESLWRLDSAAESRSGDKPGRAETSPGERRSRELTHCREPSGDLPDYCSCVYIVYTLPIPKYTVYTFA